MPVYWFYACLKFEMTMVESCMICYFKKIVKYIVFIVEVQFGYGFVMRLATTIINFLSWIQIHLQKSIDYQNSLINQNSSIFHNIRNQCNLDIRKWIGMWIGHEEWKSMRENNYRCGQYMCTNIVLITCYNYSYKFFDYTLLCNDFK